MCPCFTHQTYTVLSKVCPPASSVTSRSDRLCKSPSLVLNLPGWRWGSITQNPLVAVSRPLHSGVCETRQDAGLPVLHSKISDSGLLRTRGGQRELRSRVILRARLRFHATLRGGVQGSFSSRDLSRGRTGSHVRLAHGTFVRPHAFTVAILAQGTNRGDALCAALLLRRVGSNPRAELLRFAILQRVEIAKN